MTYCPKHGSGKMSETREAESKEKAANPSQGSKTTGREVSGERKRRSKQLNERERIRDHGGGKAWFDVDYG